MSKEIDVDTALWHAVHERSGSPEVMVVVCIHGDVVRVHRRIVADDPESIARAKKVEDAVLSAAGGPELKVSDA